MQTKLSKSEDTVMMIFEEEDGRFEISEKQRAGWRELARVGGSEERKD